MGANCPIWVEVYVTRKEWRQSYGVGFEDAIANLDREHGVTPTGRASLTDPTTEGETP